MNQNVKYNPAYGNYSYIKLPKVESVKTRNSDEKHTKTKSKAGIDSYLRCNYNGAF